MESRHEKFSGKSCALATFSASHRQKQAAVQPERQARDLPEARWDWGGL
jgi:hypothetical protein